jgi:hypothetical protein
VSGRHQCQRDPGQDVGAPGAGGAGAGEEIRDDEHAHDRVALDVSEIELGHPEREEQRGSGDPRARSRRHLAREKPQERRRDHAAEDRKQGQ